MRISGSGNRRVVDWEGALLIEEIGDAITDVQKKRVLEEK
jgi:hypothetical protein